jgi:hypothetical protein
VRDVLALKIIGGAIVGGAAILGLISLPPSWRKWIIALVTFIAGLFYFLEFVLPESFLTDWLQPVGNALMVISAFALGLGMVNLILIHARNVSQRKPGWYNSLSLLVSMAAMIIFGFWNRYGHSHIVGKIYDVLFNGMLVPLQNTMFSILAFYIVSAAYRAFRIKSLEATLMMIAAVIVMLGQVPIGTWLSQWGWWPKGYKIPEVANWLLTVVNSAAVRGVGFGIAVGAIATSLRIWLSLERGVYFEQIGGGG